MCNIKSIVMVASLLWISGSLCLRADLIQPTRTLRGENVKPGRLIVFTEPPGLMVSLDGKTVGRAPVFLESVAQGSHELEVAGKKTPIVVAPGEALRLSFFKGKFIEIVPEQTDAAAQPQTAEQKPVQQPGPQQKPQTGEQLEPGYFPLKPSGPIY